MSIERRTRNHSFIRDQVLEQARNEHEINISEPHDKIIEVGRHLNIQEHEQVQQLRRIPKHIGIRQSITHDKKHREQNNEPADALTELFHDRACVHLFVGVRGEGCGGQV